MPAEIGHDPLPPLRPYRAGVVECGRDIQLGMDDSKLTEADLPITAMGTHIYSPRQSSPIATAWDDKMAQDIADRLNQSLQYVVIPRYRMDG